MTVNKSILSPVPWRKAKRPLLLRIAFFLILAGFAAGYCGGVNGSTPLIACAFTFWGAASALALAVK